MNNNKHWVTRSKTGIPCLWESGGGATNTGESRIIAGADGAPKKPIYIKKSGHLSNGEHALIPVKVEDYVIIAYHHRQDFDIKIYKITGFDQQLNPSGESHSSFASSVLTHHFNFGEWDKQPDKKLDQAIDAAMAKATTYHCREAFYIAE